LNEKAASGQIVDWICPGKTMCRALTQVVMLGGTKPTKTKKLLIKRIWNGR